MKKILDIPEYFGKIKTIVANIKVFEVQKIVVNLTGKQNAESKQEGGTIKI